MRLSEQHDSEEHPDEKTSNHDKLTKEAFKAVCAARNYSATL